MMLATRLGLRRASSLPPVLAPALTGAPDAALAAAHGVPPSVRIVDVGARDGLQNEKKPVGTADKVALIGALADAGVPTVEAAAFVSPKWVPQMADAREVMAAIAGRVEAGECFLHFAFCFLLLEIVS